MRAKNPEQISTDSLLMGWSKTPYPIKSELQHPSYLEMSIWKCSKMGEFTTRMAYAT